jgi:hypothetical protein
MNGREEKMENRILQRVIKTAAFLALALLLAASLAGILLNDGGDPRTVESVRGEAVRLFGGAGIFRYDTVVKAVFFDGINRADLLLVSPLLAVLVFVYPRGGRLSRLLLASVFAYLAYFFLIGVAGNAFNELFLIWTLLFSAGLFGLGAVLLELDVRALAEDLRGRFPHRAFAVYLFALGGLLLVQYLTEVIGAYATRAPPASLGVYTTLELASLEIGIMVPLHVLGGVLLWKKQSGGYILAAVLVFTAAMAFINLSVGQYLLLAGYQTGSAMELTGLAVPAAVATGFSAFLFWNIRVRSRGA